MNCDQVLKKTEQFESLKQNPKLFFVDSYEAVTIFSVNCLWWCLVNIKQCGGFPDWLQIAYIKKCFSDVFRGFLGISVPAKQVILERL